MKKMKIMSLLLAGATAASLMSPVVANAATATIDIDESVAKVAAHRAAETAPMILGANLTTASSISDDMVAIFGAGIKGADETWTTWNSSPNQYLFNSSIIGPSEYVEDKDNLSDSTLTKPNSILLLSGQVSPMGVDAYYGSVLTKPNIFLGNTPTGGMTYSDVLAKYNLSYKFEEVAYKCDNLDEMVETMNKLAADMVAVDPEHAEDVGLYGNPVTIANNYQKYVEKTKENVKALIDSGKLEEAKIAVVSTADEDGKYIAYTEKNEGRTSVNRAAQYLSGVTENIVDIIPGLELANENVPGAYLIDADDLAEADYIITVGFQGSDITVGTDAYNALLEDYEEVTGYDEEEAEDRIFATLPGTTYGIYMNSVENALGQAIMIMGVYGDQKEELGVDTNDAVAYFYDNFYHILDGTDGTPDYLDTAADTVFAGGGNRYVFGYKASDKISADDAAEYEAFLNK